MSLEQRESLFIRKPRLCIALDQEAKNLGYEKMGLDTLDRMNFAIGLYKSLGFKEIDPYRFNPDPTTKYIELSLR